MVSNILSTDTCVGPGTGMVTTWMLSGTSLTYDGNLVDTDGYMIHAYMLWQPINTADIITEGDLDHMKDGVVTDADPTPAQVPDPIPHTVTPRAGMPNLTNSVGETIAAVEADVKETVFGTCITVVDEKGVESTRIDDGNLAICHWFYLKET